MSTALVTILLLTCKQAHCAHLMSIDAQQLASFHYCSQCSETTASTAALHSVPPVLCSLPVSGCTIIVQWWYTDTEYYAVLICSCLACYANSRAPKSQGQPPVQHLRGPAAELIVLASIQTRAQLQAGVQTSGACELLTEITQDEGRSVPSLCHGKRCRLCQMRRC